MTRNVHCCWFPHVDVSLMKEHFQIHSPLILETSTLPAVTRARRQRGMIVRHQKKQQSICKLPSWRYMQTKRENCSSWKTTIIPRSFPYTRFTDSIYIVLYSYIKIVPQSPFKRTGLHCKPEEHIQCRRGYVVLPSSQGTDSTGRLPPTRRCHIGYTVHQHLFSLCYCQSRSQITTRNLY